MIKTLKYIFTRIERGRKVLKLDISEAGLDSDGDPFVQLKDGLRFFGEKSYPKDKKFYQLLPSGIKKVLPFLCYRTAEDIVIRYLEGGLKYGGPYKNHTYEVKENDTVAEMGAYMGFYSLKLCEKVGEKGRVIAIEPFEDNLKLLRKNLEYNNFKQCTIVPKGVWKERSVIDFYRKSSDHQSGSIIIEGQTKDILKLQVDSLENIMNEVSVSKCDLMIIQLNGVELDAIKGLQSFKPINLAIAARYDKPGENAIEDISEVLEGRDYSLEVVEDRFIFATLNE